MLLRRHGTFVAIKGKLFWGSRIDPYGSSSLLLNRANATSSHALSDVCVWSAGSQGQGNQKKKKRKKGKDWGVRGEAEGKQRLLFIVGRGRGKTTYAEVRNGGVAGRQNKMKYTGKTQRVNIQAH